MSAVELLKIRVDKAEESGIDTDMHLGKHRAQAEKDAGTWVLNINVKQGREILAIHNELLEALRKINDVACYASEENTEAMQEGMLLIGNLARAAIQKAEGQS
jgi:hypothetical protein